MKRIIYLLPFLFVILACQAQPQPTRNVSETVPALTAIAQNTPQVVTPQPSLTATIPPNSAQLPYNKHTYPNSSFAEPWFNDLLC